MSDYFEKLDQYLAPAEENRFLSGNTTGSEGAPKLNKPITPISKLGTTFGEKTGGQNSTILSNMIASIRQGTGQLQLAIQTPTNAQMGGGVSSVGKTQRQAIKEMLMASEIQWEGLEMPTSNMSNMSGFDPQQGGFSEQKRQDDLRHVKDAILFSAEIGAGGSVDIWSQEFSRDISDASFQKTDKTGFKDFEGYDQDVNATKMLVDDRTGQAVQLISKHLGGQNNPEISIPMWKQAKEHGVGPNGKPYNPGDYLDAEGNGLKPDSNDKNFIMSRVPEWNEKEKKFESQKMKWSEFKEYSKKRNQEEGVNRTAEEWWQRTQLENAYAQQRAQAIYHTQRYEKEKAELDRLVSALKEYKKMEAGKNEKELMMQGLLVKEQGGSSLASQYHGIGQSRKWLKKSEIIEQSIGDLKQSMKHVHESSGLADAQAEAVWANIQHVKPVEEYAKEKAWNSYSELGIFSLEQTKQHNPVKPIVVGPELGWPQGYGGHTDEFIEIIQGSREKMVEKMKQDSFYSKQYSEKEMKDLAKKHIRGVLDTSHLSMWYSHFPKKHPHETEKEKLGRFNKWYLKQMDKLAEADVVGSVQIVDSATGDHRHMAVGEGIFPTVDAVKRLQEKGWDGAILSEGHEDEATDPGKIQYSLWSEFGASIGGGGSTGYHFGTNSAGNAFGNIYGGKGGAAGYRAPANYIVGGYAPSNEWKLWTEVPLE